MKTTICTVAWNPKARTWTLTCADTTFTQSERETKDKAVWKGRQIANQHRPSLLRILRRDGSQESEFSYHQRTPTQHA